jgi:hypothetical protein
MQRIHLKGNWEYIPGKIKDQEGKFAKSCELAKGETTRQYQRGDPESPWLLQSHSRVFILEPFQDKRNEQSEPDAG